MASAGVVSEIDAQSLLKTCVRAATGVGLPFSKATGDVTIHQREVLSRALRMDVDQWRQEFGDRLRETGTKLLERLNARADDLKPGEIAYSLAVVVDKAAALDSRSQVANAAINVQINNYGQMTKEQLMATMQGNSTQLQGLQQAGLIPAQQPMQSATSDVMQPIPASAEDFDVISRVSAPALIETEKNVENAQETDVTPLP